MKYHDQSISEAWLFWIHIDEEMLYENNIAFFYLYVLLILLINLSPMGSFQSGQPLQTGGCFEVSVWLRT